MVIPTRSAHLLDPADPALSRQDLGAAVRPQRYSGRGAGGALQGVGGPQPGRISATIRARVDRARAVQLARFHTRKIYCNAQMSGRELKRFCVDRGAVDRSRPQCAPHQRPPTDSIRRVRMGTHCGRLLRPGINPARSRLPPHRGQADLAGSPPIRINDLQAENQPVPSCRPLQSAKVHERRIQEAEYLVRRFACECYMPRLRLPTQRQKQIGCRNHAIVIKVGVAAGDGRIGAEESREHAQRGAVMQDLGADR